MKRLWGVVLLLLVAACGGEGADDSAVLTQPSATPRAERSAAATTEPSLGATTGARSPGAATPAPADAPKESSTDSRPTSSGLVRPATGKYGFHEEGTRRAGSAGQDQPYEDDGTLTVSASGAGTTLRFESDRGSEELTLRYEANRAFLERARLEQSVATFDARFDPPQLVLRSPLRVGDAWTNTWKANGTSGTTKIRVARNESVSAMGKTWSAFVLTNETTASGDAKGNTTSTTWYVPELGLDVKRVSDFDGTYQGIAYKQHSERTLTSRP